MIDSQARPAQTLDDQTSVKLEHRSVRDQRCAASFCSKTRTHVRAEALQQTRADSDLVIVRARRQAHTNCRHGLDFSTEMLGRASSLARIHPSRHDIRPFCPESCRRRGKPLETQGNWPFYLVVVCEFRVAGFPEN